MFKWVLNVPLNLSYEFCYNFLFFSFFLQKCGTAGCRILYLLKQGGKRAYLLHDSNGRYAQDAIPMREGTTEYRYVPKIKTPLNCVKINATECFPGNILAPQNKLAVLIGIPCNRARVYIAEYNFRLFVANNENVGDSIIKTIANTYGTIFMQCMFTLAFLPPSLH